MQLNNQKLCNDDNKGHYNSYCSLVTCPHNRLIGLRHFGVWVTTNDDCNLFLMTNSHISELSKIRFLQ
jgi:hypothetical protein